MISSSISTGLSHSNTEEIGGMYRARFTMLATLVVAMMALDAASAAGGRMLLGRRRWARRKAELHADLSTQLSGQVTEQVDAAQEQLESRVDERADKLSKRVGDEFNEFEAKTRSYLELQTQVFKKQIDAEAAQLRKESQQQLADQVAAMRKEHTEALAGLEKQHKSEIAAAVTKFNRQLDAERKKLQDASIAATASIRREVAADVAKRLEDAETKLAAANAPFEAPPAPEPPAAPAEENAVPNERPAIQEDDEEESGNEDARRADGDTGEESSDAEASDQTVQRQ
jgi:hypothetical protein